MNKYPNIQFEEALNYHKRFAELLEMKKRSKGNFNEVVDELAGGESGH